MLCRKAWIPPGRGGKSLVTIRVLCIAADPTEPPRHARPGASVARAAGSGTSWLPRDPHTDGQEPREDDGRRTVPHRTADRVGADPGVPAAVRAEGGRLPRPGRHHRRVGDLSRLVYRAAYRNVSAERRHLAVPARGGPGGALPRAAAVPGVHHRVLRAGVPRRPGDAGAAVPRRDAVRAVARRRLGVGGRGPPAGADGVRALRRDGDRGGGGGAARRGPPAAAD